MTQINVAVAVAVIHFGEKYLLGYRNAEQHQGNRYEFIGGKIENSETPDKALIREVKEEIGLDLTHNTQISPLGVLRHEYLDKVNHNNSKSVCLHVYRVQLTKAEYDTIRPQNQGCEGQSLHWVRFVDLILNKYPLPEANKTILEWLGLPDFITITKDQTYANDADSEDYSRLQKAWLDFYSDNLYLNSCVYVRLKQVDIQQQSSTVLKLIELRPDLKLILGRNLTLALQHKKQLPTQVIAQHLTQVELLNETLLINQHENELLVKHLPITVSCHDHVSVIQSNKLAQFRLNNKLSPVVGAFISPINSTPTHPDRLALGWEGFNNLASHLEVPAIALGGITPLDIHKSRMYGGDKVAGVRRFLI